MSGGAVPSKKPKTYHFHGMGGGLFFTISYSKCICLICQSTITIPKKGNVERHFRTVHRNYDTDFPLKSELRKVKKLKSQLFGEQSFFSQLSSKAKAATEASFRVSHSMIKHKKSFQDGEMIKEAFVEAADSLFLDFKNKPDILSSIKALQLSRSTVTWHCEVMART